MNQDAAETVFPTFLCPSNPGDGRIPGSEFGATTYAACAGSGLPSYGDLRSADGVFFNASVISTGEVWDGTSHTVAFGERSLGTGQNVGTGIPARIGPYMWEISNTSPPTPAACETRDIGQWYTTRGEKWIIGNYGNTLYNHYYPPNAAEWDCMNITQQRGLTTARSYHPGCVQLLYCDGSVHTVQDNVDLNLWRALATRDGGEPLGN